MIALEDFNITSTWDGSIYLEHSPETHWCWDMEVSEVPLTLARLHELAEAHMKDKH